MRVYISADMEGATGVVNVDQTDCERPEYAFGCRMQLHDVNAVVDGLLDAGVDDILVNDSHDRMINLDAGGLNPRARLLSGWPKVMGMLEGYEGADAAFFVAYHAMAGTECAVLDHTVSGRRVYSVVLNGVEVGEIGLNAAACAGCGVPVALVTGDRAACGEAVGLLGDGVTTACVKTAHGRCAARSAWGGVRFGSAAWGWRRCAAGRTSSSAWAGPDLFVRCSSVRWSTIAS